MTSVRLEQITHRFGDTVALSGINLQIAAGELFFLLGPSGCGKSTLLRLIAGLLDPTAGKIFFNERDVTSLPTQQRNAVMCFQSYALWPHMTVRQNILFGLEARGMPADRRQNRLDEVLRLVQLQDLADRKPAALSGGQQQRCALARALAVQPDCLLLDEPLSNLDAKLRLEMRTEIRRICKSAGFTTIYVTHDQKEALAVADRLAVMKQGRIAQVGTPAEMYQRPASSFVADFLGQINLLRGDVIRRGEKSVHVKTSVGEIAAVAGDSTPDRVILGIRPEKIRFAGAADNSVNRIAGKIIESTFGGDTTEYVLASSGERIRFICDRSPAAPTDAAVEFDPADVRVLAE
jgi:ABC-type Fe3+/spermidine/putrescine transport system ATPase subunit